MLGEMDLNATIYQIDRHFQGNTLHIMREDMLPFSFGGNKVRIAIELFDDFKRKNCDCIISYGSKGSNLNRVIANMAACMEIPCYIITSENQSDQISELFNDKMVGMSDAKVISCDRENVLETVEQVLVACNQKGLKPYYVYGNSDGTGNESVHIAAYYKVYEQILSYEFNNSIRLDYIFLATGTGMTQAGLLCGMIDASDAKTIVGISVSKTQKILEMGIVEGIKQFFPGRTIDFSELICLEDQFACGGYGRYNEEIFHTIIQILVNYGIPLDRSYTGKAFWGMKAYLERNSIKGKHILFLHTGGTPLFFDAIRDYGRRWDEKMV